MAARHVTVREATERCPYEWLKWSRLRGPFYHNIKRWGDFLAQVTKTSKDQLQLGGASELTGIADPDMATQAGHLAAPWFTSPGFATRGSLRLLEAGHSRVPGSTLAG